MRVGHTDFPFRKFQGGPPPRIIGHEIAAEVVDIGKNVTKFAIGDRLAVGADAPCGQCVFCKAGIWNNCQINYAMGYQFDGGFAQYMLLNPTVVNFGPVHKLPPHVTYDEGALAEPLGCVLKNVFRVLRYTPSRF